MDEPYQYHEEQVKKMKRRELFGFLFSSVKEMGREKEEETVVIRPPYFLDVDAFGKECPKCDAPCVTSCQEQIIIIEKDATPSLDFSKRGCTYCDECAIACPNDVLHLEYKKQIDVAIVINKNKCLSWQSVMCFSCKDPCLEDAIDFKAMFEPDINEKCTSCGFCISRCPVNAIEIKKVNK